MASPHARWISRFQGISLEVMRSALDQAREGRMHILGIMAESISEARADLSPFAPRLTTIQIPVEMIGAVIGTGGETIRGIVAESGAEISIEEDGTVVIAAVSGESSQKAVEMIRALTEQPEPGKVYRGKVTQIREGLGAIIEFLPRKTGLLHISQIDHHRVENVEDVLSVGDRVEVKLVEIQDDGKFRLSRKALLPRPEGMEEEQPRERSERRDGDRGGYRGGDRGDRGGYRGGNRDDRGGRGGDRGGDRRR